MEIKGIVLSADGNELVIRANSEIDIKELLKSEQNGHVFGIFETYEKDTITDLQRKHFYALMGDYEEYTGVPLDSAESYFKYNFMIEKDLDLFPSLARNQMKKQRASDLLEYVITFFIQNDVPFRKQQWYLTTDASRILFALTMKRLCWVCGKEHSDIHHATNLVGMGNDRKQHDHWNSTYMSLCREHHNEAHSMGLIDFCRKHIVKPVRLSVEHLKELRLI